MLALAKAHHVGVVLREQAHRRTPGVVERGVGHVDVDLRGEPLSELAEADRRVCVRIAPRDLLQRRDGLPRGLCAEPVLRVHERDPRALRRAEAQQARGRRVAEEPAPAGGEPLARLRPDALDHGVRELLPRQPPPTQSLADRGRDRGVLLVLDGAQSRSPERELSAGWMCSVPRVVHVFAEPRRSQSASRTSASGRSLDASGELQLGRAQSPARGSRRHRARPRPARSGGARSARWLRTSRPARTSSQLGDGT